MKYILLSEAWEKYRSDKRIEGYSPLTLKMYGFQCDLDIRMGDITTENLKQYLGEAGRHLKPFSLGHRESLFKWTHE